MRRIALLLLAFISIPALSQSGFKPSPLEKAPVLPSPIRTRVETIKSVADKLVAQKKYSDAIREYWHAYELLPQPEKKWRETAILLVAIGEANFLVGNHEACRDNLSVAMQSPGAFGTPTVHLRLGVCQYELGNMERAADELARAYIPAGKIIFQERDQKYLAFVKSKLSPPPGGWPNGW